MADDIQSQIRDATKIASSAPAGSGTGQGTLAKQLANIHQEIAEKDIAREAKDLGYNYVSLPLIPLRGDVIRILTREQVESAQVAVFSKSGNSLHVACVDPKSPETQKILQELTARGFTAEIFMCSREGITHVLKQYDVGVAGKTIELKSALGEEAISLTKSASVDFTKLAEQMKNLTIAEALNFIQLLSIQLRASDVHIEPTEKGAVLRYRIDGLLRDAFTFDRNRYEQIVVQIKHSAGVKINVKNIPQDGEYNFLYQDRKIRVRMSTLPTELGESVVLRVLDSSSVLIDFEQLGFEKGNLLVLEEALGIPYGMILVTGPTGSGKTTTLYTCLRHLSKPEKKVITLEDPMEYELAGIVQSEVHPDEGYNFNDGLRAILRQDPDVIMIGEIRDKSSAQTACQSALTGHVVLSTLHTNSALESIARLVDMGVKPFVLAPAIHTVMAQRLVRVLCEKCKAERPISESEKREISSHIERIQKIRPQSSYVVPEKVFDAHGCDACRNSGFSGRLAITEIISTDDDLKNAILSNMSLHDLVSKVTLEKNMLFMIEDGIIKVLEGKTSLAEVMRAVGE